MNQSNMITRTRLAEILDAYGAASQRWPATERQAAEQLCAVDPTARRMLEEAKALDGMLDMAPEPSPSAALRRAVAEIPLRHPRSSPASAPWLLRTVWRTILSAALVTALGVVAGAWSAEVDDAQASWMALSSLTLATYLDEELLP